VTVGAQAPELKIPNPTPEFYSNDFANVIDDATERDIVSMGESTFKATNGGQVVFVSIDSLNGATIEEYANTLFNKWKIGTKDKGILFIISMKDRQSRIEVGYGYEGVLTDLESNKLLSKFSEIAQEKGIDEAAKTVYYDISSVIRGEGDSTQYQPNEWTRQETNAQNNYSKGNSVKSIILVIIIIVLIIIDFTLTGGQFTFLILRMALTFSGRGGGDDRNSGGGGRSGGGGSSSGF
jgi:uncharacterized protein